MFVAINVILLDNYRLPFAITNIEQERGERVHITLAQQVTFLNKASVLRTLDTIPDDSSVEIDASSAVFIHPDVIEIIENFTVGAQERRIQVTVHDLERHKHDRTSTGMKVDVTLPGGSATVAPAQAK
jgi:MFS superfamily sulfate permease-like transporter